MIPRRLRAAPFLDFAAAVSRRWHTHCLTPSPRRRRRRRARGLFNRKEFAMADRDRTSKDMNPDPITGAPGSHPVGTGVGAAGGGAAGAAIGSMAGPIGTAVGAVVGAVAGGLAGKGAAEAIDPTAEDAY